MAPEIVLICVSGLVLSALLTGMARKLAVSHGVLDLPNERSSHSTATPRGGGAAFVLVGSATLLLLAWLGRVHTDLLAALIGGGLAVATIGFLDDRRSVPVGLRLAVHLGSAIWALFCLGGLPVISLGDHIVRLGWAGNVLGVLCIVWTLNLFNFMDGIDGIAASEAVFILIAGGALTLVQGGSSEVPLAGFTVAAACVGFLLWNWPPAKVFMGDVGSGYLGYVIGVLAIVAIRDNPTALWVWLILGGVFFVDATLTLVRRLIRGERVHEAHRSHAYQWLARRWRSHRRVTLTVTVINVTWLLPCAAVGVLQPRYLMWMVVIALTPLVVLALAAGSGRRESPG